MTQYNKETISNVNKYLERLIANRTQGDDVIHSLKHTLKELIDTVNNLDEIMPSFNVICFMFTFLIESRINVFKHDISQVLNKYLHIYSKNLLEENVDSMNIVEMDKFLDVLVLNYNLFVDKYKINKNQLHNFKERLRHSFKETNSITYSPTRRQQTKRKTSNRRNNASKTANFDTIDYNEVSFHQQLSKYMYLQDHSSQNNDQVEFLNLSSLNNYSLDLHGEIMFYLNFFNYNKESKGRITENNNVVFKSLNYLKVFENEYEESLSTPLVNLDPKYKCFTLLNQFFILKSFKEDDFIVKLFNEVYTLEENRTQVKTRLVIARQTMYSFLSQLIQFVKEFTLPEHNEPEHLEDIILEYVDTCFLLCFKLQSKIDYENEKIDALDLKKIDMTNLVNKLLLEDYLECIDIHDKSNLYYYYFKNYLIKRKFKIFDNNIKPINELKTEMSTTILEILIELDDY